MNPMIERVPSGASSVWAKLRGRQLQTTGRLAALAFGSFLLVLAENSGYTKAQSGGQSLFGMLQGQADPVGLAMGGRAPVWGPVGLGGAVVNPALLENAMGHRWFGGWARRPAGLNQGAFVLGIKPPTAPTSTGMWYGAWGLQATTAGTMTQTDAFGNAHGTFQAGEAALQGVLAHRFHPNLNWGLQTSIFSSFLGPYTAWGVGCNIGLRYIDTTHQWGLSLLLEDVQLVLRDYVTRSARPELPPARLSLLMTNRLKYLPLRWSLGLNNLQNWSLNYNDPNDPYQATNLDLSGSETTTQKAPWLDAANELYLHLVLNAELQIGQALRIRGGYQALQRTEWAFPERSGSSGFTWGLGLGNQRYRLDIGTGALTLAGRRTALSLSWNLH